MTSNTVEGHTPYIECSANGGKNYRVHPDEHGNFLLVEVLVRRQQGFDYWRKVWNTSGGKDPSTTACCAMRAARTALAKVQP